MWQSTPQSYSIGKALSVLINNVKKQQPFYDIHTDHREVLLDFDDAEADAFIDSFGKNITNIIRGCSVHFMQSAMRVATHQCTVMAIKCLW